MALIQGGISSLTDWSGKEYYIQAKEAYIGTAKRALGSNPQPDLIVFPESAIPYMYEMERLRILPELTSLWAIRPSFSLLQGTFFREQGERIANGALLSSASRWDEGIYIKLRLVPYGEFVPLAGVARFLRYPWGEKDLTAGKKLAPLKMDKAKLAVGVCFDNLFPFIFRSETNAGADVIVLLTNNSWFSSSASTTQHIAIDFYRAVENRRSLARASTTGISHVISPSGDVLAATKRDEQAFLLTQVPLNDSITLYGLMGDTFAYAVLFISILALTFLSIVGPYEELL